jgi:hypothetical protein
VHPMLLKLATSTPTRWHRLPPAPVRLSRASSCSACRNAQRHAPPRSAARALACYANRRPLLFVVNICLVDRATLGRLVGGRERQHLALAGNGARRVANDFAVLFQFRLYGRSVDLLQ